MKKLTAALIFGFAATAFTGTAMAAPTQQQPEKHESTTHKVVEKTEHAAHTVGHDTKKSGA